ncbi:hypothetical protein PFISCL1PPCAC_5686, partial [Pristionchus fissidentatus]
CKVMAETGEPAQTYNYTYEDFERAHKSQLLAGDVPQPLWEQLFSKLANEVFDAGDFMSLVYEDDQDSIHQWKVITSQELDCNQHVFIIDHAWTFEMNQQRKLLISDSSLRARMAALVGLEDDDEKEESSDEEVQGVDTKEEENGIRRERRESRNEEKKENLVDDIIERLWRYIGTYSIRYKKEEAEESCTVWYVMDELGCRIGHSREEANARVIPLFFAPHGLSYSVLFFSSDVPAETTVFRDCTQSLVSLQHPEWAEILELAWTKKDFSHLPTTINFPDEEFFAGGRSNDETASDEDQSKCAFKPSKPLKIFTDHLQLVENLTLDIEPVEDWKKADIIWLHQHFRQYSELATSNPGGLVNQFPCECCLTTKDLLAAIMCKGGTPPDYYQMTYNLNTELPQFVSTFQRRTKAGESNTWIVKPWNLARGMDMHVCDSLEKIVRLVETGPKIACKYIDRPVTFKREDTGKNVKFDLRFIVFVNSLRPLEAYVYNNFWIRFAINEFDTDRLDDVETHFTVFNYADPAKILQMKWEDFVVGLEKSNSNLKWKECENKIHESLRSILEKGSSESAPRGVGKNAQSRAMYGVDVMLQWNDDRSDVSPSILEINFMPDCARACEYYPDFADTVFNTLFLQSIDQTKVTKL